MSSVSVYDNFFDKDTLKEVNIMFNDYISKPGWGTHSSYFPQHIVPNPGVVLVTQPNDILVQGIATYYLEKGIFKQLPEWMNLLLYVGYAGSSIHWHTDGVNDLGQERRASSIYLTPDWQDEWGGYFLYKEQDHIRALAPTYNRAVVVEQDVEHCSAVLGSNCEPRRSIQVFFDSNAI
jgi:hypothetical protein